MKSVFKKFKISFPTVTSLSPNLGKMGQNSDLLIYIGRNTKYACRLIWGGKSKNEVGFNFFQNLTRTKTSLSPNLGKMVRIKLKAKK